MAKSTPAPDMNEPAPDAVAALPPAEPSVTTAPDGTLVVTTTEVESSDATISVQPTIWKLEVRVSEEDIEFADLKATEVQAAIAEAQEVLSDKFAGVLNAVIHPPGGDPVLVTLHQVEAARSPDTLSEKAREGLDDFLVKFERKVSERDGVRKILAAAEHDIQAVGQWPTRIEQALALPLADELDTLHEVEGLVIASFMDVGDVVRKVYLNVLGHFVKA